MREIEDYLTYTPFNVFALQIKLTGLFYTILDTLFEMPLILNNKK